MSIVRHLGAVALLGGLVLGGYHLAASTGTQLASLADDASPVLPAGIARRLGDLAQSYSLANLSILGRAFTHVEYQYVDPERIDHGAMFKAALAAVERDIPEVMLRVEQRRVHVQVGDFVTVLSTRPIETQDALVAELRRVAQVLEDHLHDPAIDMADVEYALVNGALGTLDPHTLLMPPTDAKRMEEDNEGAFGGLGIGIRMEEGRLLVDYPMEGTPAWQVGLKPADHIVAIDGEGTINMDTDEAVRKMRGQAGTRVTLTIDRAEFGTPRDFTITRAEIKPGRVWSEFLDGGVGYVRIENFHIQVESQLEEELGTLSRRAGPAGLRGLVIDLRDNPGGYLHQAVAVADKFMPGGVVVSTVGRAGSDRKENEARDNGAEPTYPIAVLMSGASASAAEIVAGALKNTERAVVIGERSFGKGSVQELYRMERDAQLKLTVARYFTPGDHSIQSIGIPPDIEVKRAYVYPPRRVEEWDQLGGPRVSMFSRDNLLAEADLEGHLAALEEPAAPPVYAVRFLVPERPADAPRTERKDVRQDFEVLLARDVLVAARGGRRADVLRTAGSVVAQRGRIEEERIGAAFAALGIDWSGCVNPERPQVALSLAAEGQVGTPTWIPGAFTAVTATVSNQGAVPLCQLVVRADGGEPGRGEGILDGTEFYIGRVEPGQARSFTTKVLVPGGYPAEQARVALRLHDLSRENLSVQEIEVASKGEPLPRYGWDFRFDDASGGDGDGVVEVGETVHLLVDVHNFGQGPGGKATVEVHKGSEVGKAVALVDAARARIEGLAPGASQRVDVAFRVAAAPPGNTIPLDISVQDSRRYDYASVNKGGFYTWYGAKDTVVVPVGSGPPPTGHREPPDIDVTRAPGLSTSDASATVSGVVTDDSGVRDVIVYRGAEKIAYHGGGEAGRPLRSIPFSATADIVPGSNLFVVLARDVDGLRATRGVGTWREAAVAAVPGAAPPRP